MAYQGRNYHRQLAQIEFEDLDKALMVANNKIRDLRQNLEHALVRIRCA